MMRSVKSATPGSIHQPQESNQTSGEYAELVKEIGESGRDFVGGEDWSVVARWAEVLWKSYEASTGLNWGQVAERVHQAWSDMAPGDSYTFNLLDAAKPVQFGEPEAASLPTAEADTGTSSPEVQSTDD
jgi:hypothetical protein